MRYIHNHSQACPEGHLALVASSVEVNISEPIISLKKNEHNKASGPRHMGIVGHFESLRKARTESIALRESKSASYDNVLPAAAASFLVAQPLMQNVMTSHAMMRPVRPIVTVKMVMASSPLDSIAQTMSCALIMNMSPPAIKQNDETNSVGGLAGKCEVGGLR